MLRPVRPFCWWLVGIETTGRPKQGRERHNCRQICSMTGLVLWEEPADAVRKSLITHQMVSVIS